MASVRNPSALGLPFAADQPGMHALYMHALYACLICMPYMYAWRLCATPLLLASILLPISLVCSQRVCALYACPICMPYMHALCE